MSPTQHKLLVWGVPVVAALALIVYLRSRSSSSAPAGSSGTLPGTTAAGDTAVGLGQLANFENSIGAGLAQLQGEINGIQSGSTTATPLPAPAPPNLSGLNPSAGYALSPTAASAAVGGGMTVYQTGAEAIAWDTANGVNPTGIDPNALYALSPAAASAAVAGGMTVYQTGAEALAWEQAHSGAPVSA